MVFLEIVPYTYMADFLDPVTYLKRPIYILTLLNAHTVIRDGRYTGIDDIDGITPIPV